MKTKIFLFSCAFFLAPLLTNAQFVEQPKETPSEFSIQGRETFNTVIDAMNVFLALLFVSSLIGLVISGIKFIVAGGDEGVLGGARKTGMASLVGIILSLVGYVIINVIKHFLN